MIRGLVFVFVIWATSCSTSGHSSSMSENISFAQAEAFQLSTPQLMIDSILFVENAEVYLDLDVEGVELFYTLDGAAVSKKSKKYIGPLEIDASTELKVKAFHPEYLPSKEVLQKVFKVKALKKGMKIHLQTQANKNYPGEGEKSLQDLKKGTLNFREGKAWSGFQAEEVLIDIDLEKGLDVERLYLSVLEDHGSWIFSPHRLELYEDKKLLAFSEYKKPEQAQPSEIKFLYLDVPPKKGSHLRLKIIPFSEIPSWHPGVGTKPWFFMDELFFE